MGITVWRISTEDALRYSDDCPIGTLSHERFSASIEEHRFSPDYFFPSSDIVNFLEKYPWMDRFSRTVCQILDHINWDDQAKYHKKVCEALKDFFNFLEIYAVRIVYSDRPIRIIAENGKFSEEFLQVVDYRRYRQWFFPWMKDLQGGEVQEFEKRCIAELSAKIRSEKYIFWVQTESQVTPVYLLIEWNSIVMVTPKYSIPYL